MAIYFAGIWFSFWKSGNTRNTKNYWLWIQAALLNPDVLNSGIIGDVYFPCGSVGKEFACNAGDPGSIPGSGRSPGEVNGNLFQYSCLENPMDRGFWQAIVHGVLRVGYGLAN